jgi:hypothetical protein
VVINGRPERTYAPGYGKSAASFTNRANRQFSGRRFDSIGAQRNYERYLALARAAASTGDMIEMENCFQHVEHYFRVMRATRGTDK